MVDVCYLCVLKDCRSDRLAQAPIALELRFGEPLVGGRFVGKLGVVQRVADNVRILVPSQPRLDVEKVAVPGSPPVDLLIADDAGGVI